MKRIFDRIREPSTMAGLSALALLFGLPPGVIDGVAQLVGGAAALAAVLLKEKNGDA